MPGLGRPPGSAPWPKAFGRGSRLPSGAVVQVVELAHRADAGQRHLGVDRPGQPVVAVRFQPAGQRVHLLPPGPEGPAAVMGAAAQRPVEGVRVGVGQARQHQARPARTSSARPAGTPALDRQPTRPAVGDQPRRPVDRRAVQPAVAGPSSWSLPATRPGRLTTAVSARTPAWQSASSACSAGECEMPVGLRTNSIAVGMPALARMPASWPAPVASTGRAGQHRPQPLGQRRRRSAVASVQDSAPAGRPGAPASSASSATSARTRSGSGPRASSQAVTSDGIAFTPLGDTEPCPWWPPSRAARRPPGRPAPAGRRPASDRAGRPAGWCRRGWPRRAARSASGRAARSREPTATGCAELDQAAALLDVQLDEAADPVEGFSIGADAGRVEAGGPHRLGQLGRRRRRSAPGPGRRASAPVISREPAQAMPNRAPSSSPKLTTPIGRAGCEARRARSASTAANADTTPERAVEGAAVGHRVQVAADHHARSPARPRDRVTPPGPLVAGPVQRQVKPAPAASAGEPLAQLVVGPASRRTGGSRRCSADRPIGASSSHIRSKDRHGRPSGGARAQAPCRSRPGPVSSDQPSSARPWRPRPDPASPAAPSRSAAPGRRW